MDNVGIVSDLYVDTIYFYRVPYIKEWLWIPAIDKY
jgi:hypothetical protein